MNALAVDTGGRALRNQNYFDGFVNDAVAETSRFYLIAWLPEGDGGKTEKLRNIEVSVIGHPELSVRSARKFAVNDGVQPAKADPKKPKDRDSELKATLADPIATGELPLYLSLLYVDTPANGPLLTTSIELPADRLSYGSKGNESAQVSIAGVIIDSEGKPATGFGTGLKVDPRTVNKRSPDSSNVIYNRPTPLKPGMYQVRVAVRDEKSGSIGSANRWIVIPDLSTRELSLSSVFIGLENVGRSRDEDRMQWSVDRKFQSGGGFRFLAFIYNAMRGQRPVGSGGSSGDSPRWPGSCLYAL